MPVTITQNSNNVIIIDDNDNSNAWILPSGVVPVRRPDEIVFVNSNLTPVFSFAAADITNVIDRSGNNTAVSGNLDTAFDTLKNTFFFSVTGTGGSGDVPADQIFTSDVPPDTRANAEGKRDTFFTANPTKLVLGARDIIIFGSTAVIQFYNGTSWFDLDTALTASEIATLLGTVGWEQFDSTEQSKLASITDVGRGQIITTAEAGEIDDSISGVSIVGQVITFTKNDGSTIPITITAGPGGPGTTTPTLPSGVIVALQPLGSAWDASTGSFPSGAQAGYLYVISANGTVDGVEFDQHDAILALVNNPSTTTFANNWHRIEGDEGVRSWAGLTGHIDGDKIDSEISRLGYQKISPDVNNFSIQIPGVGFVSSSARVDLNTDLNITTNIRFTISNRNSISSLELVVTNGDDVTLTVPTSDGPQEQSITLSGFTTSSSGTATFTVRATDTNSVTHDSNTVTINYTNAADHEQVHFGFILSTSDETNITFATNDIEARDTLAGAYTVSGIPSDSNTYRIYFAVPTALGQVTSVLQSGFNLTNQFTNVQHTISSETYNIFLMNANAAVNSNYNSTILNVT